MTDSPPERSASREEILIAAACAMAAMLLALSAVYVGTGWQDGFDYADTWVLRHRLWRQARWLAPAALLAGPALLGYYLVPADGKLRYWRILLGVARAFLHFPLYGMILMLGMMALLAKRFFQIVTGWAWAKLRRREWSADKDLESAMQDMLGRYLAIPIWFIVFPLPLFGAEPSEGQLPTPPLVALRGRMMLFLPWVWLTIAFWTNFVNEDSGERVDPHWLAVFATVWLADYLVVALQVVPFWRARERPA